MWTVLASWCWLQEYPEEAGRSHPLGWWCSGGNKDDTAISNYNNLPPSDSYTHNSTQPQLPLTSVKICKCLESTYFWISRNNMTNLLEQHLNQVNPLSNTTSKPDINANSHPQLGSFTICDLVIDQFNAKLCDVMNSEIIHAPSTMGGSISFHSISWTDGVTRFHYLFDIKPTIMLKTPSGSSISRQ